MATGKEVAVTKGTASIATKYDSILLERAGPGLSEDRISLVFRILDQMIPQMGVFTEVQKKIRDELFDAVYSDNYTGSQSRTQSTKGYIQRVPYFTLVKRVHDERDEKAEELKEQLDLVKRKLFEKQKEYESSLDSISQLNQQVDALQGDIHGLTQDGINKDAHIHKLEQELNGQREDTDKMAYQLNTDISNLKEDLQDVESEAKYLRQFKTGYDNLESAFHTKARFADLPGKRRKAAVATKRAHLKASIESAVKLEEQILTVQNASIEEFDSFLEEHKAELSQKVYAENMDNFTYTEQQHDIDVADQQLAVMEERFHRGQDELYSELNMLRQHRALLQEQLQVLEENKPVVKKSKKHKSSNVLLGRTIDSRPQTQESSMSLGLDVDEDEGDDPSADPFIPQERVFSKYAAMVYTSDNNAKTFHEFKDARYCASCGEKTVLCPHKILNQEHVFPLPPKSTHLKITRPKVRISQEILDNIMQEEGMSDIAVDTLTFSPDSHFKGNFKQSTVHMSGSQPMSPMLESKSPESASMRSMDTPGFGADSHLVNSTQRLWEDYKNRTDMVRAVSRSLSQERTLSLIEQFSAYVIWQDENAVEDMKYESLLGALYEFMMDRYSNEEVMFLATHDLLTSLVEHGGTNKIVQLFTHILINNYDGAVLRYFLLICDFIDLVEWKRVDDFRAFAAEVYPSLSDDDLENLHMGYTSFSENRISKQLVAEYLIYIILKYREPRFLEMETKLLAHPGKEANQMSESEFVEAVEAVLSLPSDRLRKRLFRETLQSTEQEKETSDPAVPILKLAQITSYLMLIQIMPKVRDTLAENVAGARERPSSAKTATTETRSQVVEGGSLMTMTNAKNLAMNIERREKCRKVRERLDMLGDEDEEDELDFEN